MMQHTDTLQRELRGLDGDLYLCHLFAPVPYRDALLVLYRLYADIARIPYNVSEPMLGAIRLQWWRDMLDRLDSDALHDGHGVPIAEALQLFWHKPFDKTRVLKLIDGREAALVEDQHARTMQERVEEADCVGVAFMELACAALETKTDAKLLALAGSGFELLRLASPKDREGVAMAHKKLATACKMFNALPRQNRKKLLPAFLPIGLARRHAKAHPKQKSLLRYQLSLLCMAFIGKI